MLQLLTGRIFKKIRGIPSPIRRGYTGENLNTVGLLEINKRHKKVISDLKLDFAIDALTSRVHVTRFPS
jgi:hypothetical protein